MSLASAKGFSSAEAAKACARAQELSEKIGDIDSQFVAIWGVWQFRRMSDLNAARELSDKLLSLVKRNKNDGLRLEAHHTGWTTHFFRGEPALAQEHCEKGRTLYDFEQHRTHAHIYGHDPGVCARMVGAWSDWLLGYPDTALARVNDGLALAERVNHPFSLALARVHASILHQFRRDSAAVLQCIESAEALAAEKRIALTLDPRVLRGWALLAPDGIGATIASFRAALSDPARQGTIQYAPYSFALLSEVLCHRGNNDGGSDALRGAAVIAEQSGERWWDAEICRLRGLVALSVGEVSESEAWLLNPYDRFAACKSVLHPRRQIVYCKDAKRRGDFPIISFDFLGFQFRARKTMWRQGTKRIFTHSFQARCQPEGVDVHQSDDPALDASS